MDINATSIPPHRRGGRITRGECIMRRIKNLAAVGLSRFLLVTAAVIGLGCASPSTAQASGGYTVYIINMARLNYKTPVYYDKIFRTGWASDFYQSTSSPCMQSIRNRVAQNKQNGWDYECFLIVYTERNPNPYLPDGGGTLANIADGAGGQWTGWIIYWTAARNQGKWEPTPYKTFRPYGRQSAPAAIGKPATLDAPAGQATNTPAAAPTVPKNVRVSQFQPRGPIPSGGVPALGRDILVGQIGVERLKAMRSVARTAIAVDDGWSSRTGVCHRGGSGSSTHQMRRKSALEAGSTAC